MKINRSDAALLLRISNGDDVTYSNFSKRGKELVDTMSEYGIIEKTQYKKNSFGITIDSSNALDSFLETYCDIADLQTYYDALEIVNPSRGELAALGVGTKLKSVSPKSGFHISSPDGISIEVNNISVTLELPAECALFVHRNAQLRVDPDVLIIGVENFENITHAASQNYLFNAERKKLFIERSPALQRWIVDVPNPYLHFGDIDLAGINIFLTEYYPLIGERGRFFIPSSIQEDIKHGKTTLYDVQYNRFRAIHSDIPEIAELITLIHDNKRTVEQELYIRR